MRINAFEGARRIVWLITLVVLVGGSFVLLTEDANPMKMVFTIAGPEAAPIWSDQDPNSYVASGALIERVNRETQKGTKVKISLCFLPMLTIGGAMLIPFEIDKDGLSVGSDLESRQVKNYVNKVTSEFQLNPQLERWADSSKWKRRLKQFWDGAVPGIISLLGLWLFTWVVGWVVRGFFGIPFGMDRSPEPAPSKNEDS